jgi:hypothetical protein
MRLDPRFEGELLIPRVMLHASELKLPSGEAFESEWPEDFGRVMRLLREDSV